MIVEIIGVDGSVSGGATVGSATAFLTGGWREVLAEYNFHEIKPAQTQTIVNEIAEAKYTPRLVIDLSTSGREDRDGAARSNDFVDSRQTPPLPA